MKKLFGLLFLCFISAVSFGQGGKSGIAIIPEPVNLIENTGHFSLPKNVVIEAGTQPEMKQVIAFLKDRLSTPTGIPVTVRNAAPSATVKLILNKKTDAVIGKEGYHLLVTPKNIVINANDPTGLFYGVQTTCSVIPQRN